MTGIAKRLRSWLMLIEIPVFVVAVLAILVKGEMNFFSEPVRYQTEPIASVGKSSLSYRLHDLCHTTITSTERGLQLF
jgi:hypothetical protein